MPDQRRVYTAGHSLVVALSPAVREHLRVEPGQAVYWHLARGGEAILGRRAVRVGGPPEGIALQKQLDATRGELDRARKKLSQRPLRVHNSGVAQGWNQATRAGFFVEELLAPVLERLDRLEARLASRPLRLPRPAKKPRSSAPPPSEVVEGEAVAPGEPLPQGHP
jgi:hypothetical protein